MPPAQTAHLIEELQPQNVKALEFKRCFIVANVAMMPFPFRIVIAQDPAAGRVDIDHRVFEPSGLAGDLGTTQAFNSTISPSS